jgi:hypothetical protein
VYEGGRETTAASRRRQARPRSKLKKLPIDHHPTPEDLVEEGGHSAHAPLHLVVAPTSGCAGFEPASVPAQGAR